jgi:hypothetical protein
MSPTTARITVSSSAFGDGDAIPRRYTCDGDDRSPPLTWSDVPEGTRELALLVEDPDAPGGTFVHWVAWGLPADLGGLDEGTVPQGTGQGVNGFGRTGWGGPCPPRGHGPHRYVFTLFALSKALTLDEGASAQRLRGAMDDAVLAQGSLTGTYGR